MGLHSPPLWYLPSFQSFLVVSHGRLGVTTGVSVFSIYHIILLLSFGRLGFLRAEVVSHLFICIVLQTTLYMVQVILPWEQMCDLGDLAFEFVLLKTGNVRSQESGSFKLFLGFYISVQHYAKVVLF